MKVRALYILLPFVVYVSNAAAWQTPSHATATPKPAPSDAECREILRDAFTILKRIDDDIAQLPQDEIPLPLGGQTEEMILALQEIGKAHWRVGDKDAARDCWRFATGIIESEETELGVQERVRLLIDLAEAQIGAGSDLAEATLVGAEEHGRRPQDETESPPHLSDRNRTYESYLMTYGSELVIRRGIAFAKVGNEAAARKAFRDARESVAAFSKAPERVAVLCRIAVSQSAPDSAESWQAAIDAACQADDEVENYSAIETLLLNQVQAREFEAAIRFVSERLKGDCLAFGLRSLAIWLAMSESPVETAIVEKLELVASKAEFDLPVKKVQFYRNLAIVAARRGDEATADRLLRAVESVHAKKSARDDESRLNVMMVLADGHWAAGRTERAKVLLQAAWKLVEPHLTENDPLSSALSSLVDTQVRTGDFAAIRVAADTMTNTKKKIDLYVAIARAEAEAGNRDAAVEAIGRAQEGLSRLRNESYWNDIPYRVVSNAWASAKEKGFIKVVSSSESVETMFERDAAIKIAVAQAAAGQYDESLKSLEPVIAKSDWPGYSAEEAIQEIAQIQARAGHFLRAYEIAALVLNDLLRMSRRSVGRMYTEIAEAQVKAGDAKAVLAWARDGTPRKSKKAAGDGGLEEQSPSDVRALRIGVLIGVARAISSFKQPKPQDY